MKVKIVALLIVSMLLLVSCGSKDDAGSPEKGDSKSQEVEKGGQTDTSSTIGGWQWTPTEVSGFRN